MCSSTEVAAELDCGRRTAQDDFKKLADEGHIERVGQNNAARWRITREGLNALRDKDF